MFAFSPGSLARSNRCSAPDRSRRYFHDPIRAASKPLIRQNSRTLVQRALAAADRHQVLTIEGKRRIGGGTVPPRIVAVQSIVIAA